MSIKYLNLSGLEDLWINIKNYILSKIPTKTSELTNDSGYLTSHQSLSNYSTLANTVKSLSISGKTITITPGSGSAYTLTTQDTVYTHPTTSGNKHIPSGGSSGQFLGWSADGTAKWVNNPNSDTKNTAGSTDTSSKIFLIGATSQAANPQTYSHDTAYVGTDGCLYSGGTKVLTAHQSLSNYLTKTTNVSEMGRYIDMHYDNATAAYDYDVRLQVNSQGTAAGGGVLQIVGASVKASKFEGPLTGNVTGNCSGSSGSCIGNAATATQFSANKSVTLTGDVTGTASSKAGWSVATTLANSGVTAGDYGPSANASPSHGGTFTVPSITVDAKGRITAASAKTITLPADSNTDTKVTQTVTTGNSAYPVLLCAIANATATETTTSRFSAGLTVNTRYSSINMTNKYDTANTKGVRNTSTYSNGYIIFRCYDASEMGIIRCESSKNGYQQTYMQARSYIKNGAISPEGTATTCYITVRVRDNGSKTIYTDGSWENSLTPYANNTYSLGTSSLQWKNAYTKKINNLEPSSLSLPNPSNSIDISAYFTHTGTGKTNTYAVPSNGWIFLYLATISSCEAKVLDTAQNVLWGTSAYSFRVMLMIPVVTGSTLQTQWTTEYSTVTVLTAKFYPCQGNV